MRTSYLAQAVRFAITMGEYALEVRKRQARVNAAWQEISERVGDNKEEAQHHGRFA